MNRIKVFKDLYMCYIRKSPKKLERKDLNDVGVEKLFLESLPDPENDFERSYYQYLCQKQLSPKLNWYVLNSLSFLLFIPFCCLLRIKCLFNRESNKSYNYVMTRDFIKEKLISKQLICKEGDYIVQDYCNGYLRKEDIYFLLQVCKAYPTSFYFLFKCMIRLADYSKAVHLYNPEMIFSSAEYSFTSSFLTAYCEYRGIQHINIMHGEKIFLIREAFSHFHKFYIWDSYYEVLFKHLKATETVYEVFKPYIPDIIPIVNNKKCTYYLQLHSSEQLYIIKKSLEKTKLEYKVRPHPSYPLKKINDIFGTEKIEDPSKIGIWKSLADAGMAVSIDSSVLHQASWLNIPIIIDDVSNPLRTKMLQSREYILFNKKHNLMSHLLENKSLIYEDKSYDSNNR